LFLGCETVISRKRKCKLTLEEKEKEEMAG
jgi:hypothetical protein